MKVLLDLNVLLDLFLKRRPWVNDAAAIWTAHQDGRITAGVAASSLPTLYYIIRKGVDRATAHDSVRDCVNGTAIWKVDAATIGLAFQQTGPDFEDNVQLACAIEAKADAIITRDPADFVGSPIPILSPADFVARLPPAPSRP
jgi:predicted nucleic acid-binding protein